MTNEEKQKQLDERTTAPGLLNYAIEYYAGYELIQKQEPGVTRYFAVKYYLLCHSLELTMKAWLKKHGETYVDLKRLGHDLERLMTVLHDKYDLSFDTISQDMIRTVNQHYSQKEFEYALIGAKSVPVITELASTVHLLISKAKFDIILNGDLRKLKKS